MSEEVRQMAAPKKAGKFWYLTGGVDMPFLIVLIIIVTIGLGCMFSASYVNAYYLKDDSYFYIEKQLIFAAIGLVALFVASAVNYHVWHKMALPVMGIAVIALIVVLFIPTDDGVQRWIPLGLFNVQASEVAKFALIVLFSHMMSLNHSKMGSFKTGFLPYMCVLAVLCVLILREPHLSGTMLIFLLGFMMMFVGGTRPVYLIVTLLAGAAILVFMIFVIGYERERIDVWLNIEQAYAIDRNVAWQTMQSLYAIGSGGLLGQGIGNSRQKHLFLPEPQNDFVFAIVCEEFGFIGALIVIALFLVLVWRGISIAIHAPDKFGFLLAVGLTMQIALQVAINIAVVTNLLPNTGISLPFFSYGGSSLIMLMAQMGILLSISRWRPKKAQT